MEEYLQITILISVTVLAEIAAHWLSEFLWLIAFLYTSLVVVTGPTVINPLLKQIGIDKQVSTLLEGEGVFIDTIGAILSGK